MIRPLRQRHRVMVCALGFMLAVAFAAGIAGRKGVPVAATVPAALAAPVNDFGKVVLTRPDLWPGQRIITSLRRDTAGSVAVELMFRDLVRPDVLVYWTAGKETTMDSLPENARLLGALANHSPLPVPSDVRGETGRLVLYSLADHEVVAISRTFQTANQR